MYVHCSRFKKYEFNQIHCHHSEWSVKCWIWRYGFNLNFQMRTAFDPFRLMLPWNPYATISFRKLRSSFAPGSGRIYRNVITINWKRWYCYWSVFKCSCNSQSTVPIPIWYRDDTRNSWVLSHIDESMMNISISKNLFRMNITQLHRALIQCAINSLPL